MEDKDLRTFDAKELLRFTGERDISGLPEESCELGCENGFIAIWKDDRALPYVSDCECRKRKIFRDWKARQIEELRMVYKKFDLDNTVPDPKIRPLQWGTKWPWLMGRTGQGKTHQSGFLLKQLINNSDRYFKWVRLTMKDFLDVLELKRSDDKGERQWAREMQERIEGADAIVMNDIGKVGNLTASRQEEIFAFADFAYERGKKVMVTSNGSIADFCAGFNHEEKTLRDRDGLAPIQRRFMDLCEEVKVVRA